MTDVSSCRARQLKAAAEYLRTGEPLALLGISDWLHEELLIEAEQKGKEKDSYGQH